MDKKIVLFPGQGSIKRQAAISGYHNSQIVKNTFLEFSEYCHTNLAEAVEDENIHDIVTISEIIFTLSIATYRETMQHANLDNAIFAGHSLGEISALTCAGVFSVRDGLKLVKKRAQIALQAGIGRMYVISGMDHEDIKEICENLYHLGEEVWICCDNTVSQVCIAGSEKSLNKAITLFKKIGCKTHYLKDNLPYHCKLMKRGEKELKDYINTLKLNSLNHIVLSDVFAQPYTSPEETAEFLSLQLSHCVRWVDMIAYLEKQNFQQCYEMGYSDILTKIILNLPHSWSFENYIY